MNALISRELKQSDYDQVVDLIESRFSIFFEYEKVKHRSIKINENGFEEFKNRSIALTKRNLRNSYLNEDVPNFKIFGTFDDDTLLSMVEMKIISKTEWILEDLKARDIPRNGMRETMRMLYQTAFDLGLTTYYAQIAAYRYEKFQKYMSRLVPEYYNEYTPQIIQVIPKGSQINLNIPVGMMGHASPAVEVYVKKMSRWISE